MNFELSDEQNALRAAARDALGRIDFVGGARAALDGGELPSVWETARSAGWTGLLVGEEHGGAGLGTFDAMLVHEELGRRLTGAGVLGHLVACEVLRASDDDEVAEILPALAAGDRRAAIALARPPVGEGAWTVDATAGGTRIPAPRAQVDGDSATVEGEAGFVPDLAGAGVLVVAAVAADGVPVAVLLEPDATGVEVEPVIRTDATRPLGHLRADGARGRALDGGGLARAWYLAQALLAADSLGVSQAMLDMSLSYAKERHTFGRPIGSYQAVKHQIVDILRHAETCRNLLYYAGYTADEEASHEFALAASAARYAGELSSDYATRTCIAVHGGIGATWEHDAPLYWRRSQLSRLLLGGTADAGDRVAEEIIAKARAERPRPIVF